MKNYKIGQFIGTLDCGGAETIIVNFSNYLIENGYENTCIIGFRNSWISGKCVEMNIPFLPLTDRLEYLWRHIKLLPIYSYFLRKFLKDNEIDILHSHLYKATILNALPCYRQGIPHVSTCHDSYTITEKRSRRYWLKLAQMLGTKLIAVSNSIKEDYDLSDMTVISNGYYHMIVPEDDSLENRNDLGISKEDIVIIIVARLIPLKRIDYLIDAINVIVNTYNIPHVRLLIVGDGSEYSALLNKIKSLKLGECIKLLGQREDVPKLLALSDLFVLPSTTEGLSCSIIEALFSSLPIVATNVGGNNELVLDNCNGKLIPVSDNPEILANAIRFVINLSKEQRSILGCNSLFFANNFLTIENMVNSYLSLYNNLKGL